MKRTIQKHTSEETVTFGPLLSLLQFILSAPSAELQSMVYAIWPSNTISSHSNIRIRTFWCSAGQAAPQIGNESTNSWWCLALHCSRFWLLMQLQKFVQCARHAKAHYSHTTCVHAVLQYTTEVPLCKPWSKHDHYNMLSEAVQSWHYSLLNPFHPSVMAINFNLFLVAL